MSRNANLLSGLDIDEVSFVRRDANGQAKIAIAKSAEEGHVPEYTDADGNAVATEDLEVGDVFYDAAGDEYVVEEVDAADEPELASVGKSNFKVGTSVLGMGGKAKAAFKPGTTIDRKKAAMIAAGGAGAAGAAGYGASKVGKSFSETILEEISKAVSEKDRNIILSKALGRIEEVEARNIELSKAFEAEQDARLTEHWVAKSAEFNLPVSPEVLGPVLKSLQVGEPLTETEFGTLIEVLKGVGDMLFAEIGAVGESADASVMAQVDSLVDGLVEKSDGFSREEATVAFFASNPDAYEAYLSSQNGR